SALRSGAEICYCNVQILVTPAAGSFMRLLGGSQFLGRAIASHACAIGHDVTCAARGLSGPMAPGVRFVHVDRDVSNGLEPLARQELDAVVDVSRHPGRVRRPVAALRLQTGHWPFSSS